jgi:Cohesin domain
MDIVTVTIHSVERLHIPPRDVFAQNLMISGTASTVKVMRRLVVLITAAILFSVVVFHPVTSVPPGTLYENPLIVPVKAVGSTFTFQIIVGGMDQFNGWDIQVVTDPSVLNVTNLSITGNMFESLGGTAFEIVHCVNGKGTGCTSADGSGIVHSAYGNTAFANGNGLLFTITFKVVSAQPYSPIQIQNDLISSSSPSGVPHYSEFGNYGALFGTNGGKRPIPT